ncbi:MAG: hypothetical protein E7295_09015 [Lachnospiraceae bacterium]|jgi:hypothetical protein|nr:hypothetical protein [Lachnospiraceae bacterium]
MSKVIHFNARNFEFDSSCNTNVGFRGFVTTVLGNEEVWEIGNWNWDWTQICANLTGLEKNMDYMFRFAMTLGHNDDNREESLVHIHYNDGDGKQAWEDPDMLEDRIGEAINDSISDFFGEGLETFLATHPLVLRDGTVVSSKQQTKVLSPDKKKLLNCYGGLTVEDTTKWNGVLPKDWGLRVQTRISCWELLYVYKTESQATEALVKVQKAIEAGKPACGLFYVRLLGTMILGISLSSLLARHDIAICC